jgi:hypothetical protein
MIVSGVLGYFSPNEIFVMVEVALILATLEQTVTFFPMLFFAS